jgi:hypothetical protein
MSKLNGAELDKEERHVYARLRTPERIQRFLDEEVAYNKEPDGPSSRGPRGVIRTRLGHCMEGALLGAAALRFAGFPPLLVDLESVRDDDHVLAVFKEHGCWGALAKSNYAGLRFREPVYRTVRELVMSYFEHYYNLQGEKTLRAYSRPVNLERFDRLGWLTAEGNVWEIPEYLCTIPHMKILPNGQKRRRMMMDRRLFEAGKWGAVK